MGSEKNKNKIDVHMVKIMLLLMTTTGVFVVWGQGCGQAYQSGLVSESAGTLAACGGASNDESGVTVEPLSNTKTLGISYGRQLVESMVSCTGLGNPSVRVRSEFERRKQALSEYGSLADYSPAMDMAVTAIAGEVCQDLIEKEIPLSPSARYFFNDFNFANPSAGAPEIEKATDLLAISCWQRKATENEKSAVVNALSQMGVTTQHAALTACAVVLSSFAFVEN
jgi:hypothetical protein